MKFWLISLYFGFWVVLCESLNMEISIIGSLVCYFIFKFNRDLIMERDNFFKTKGKTIIYSLKYFAILIREIFKSNFHVAKIVLSPKMDISPQVVTIDTNIKSPLCKTLLANSITLTPGTLTLLMEDKKLTIHCLQRENVNDLLQSDFEKILLKAEE
nr:Na+/H+ antiporter subunit E [Clostridium lundense]